MCSAFFRGTSLDQDVKFKDQEKKLIKGRKWPEQFKQKVDLNKVQLDLIKIWIERRIEELINDEDEILNNYAISLIEDAKDRKEDLCPMKM